MSAARGKLDSLRAAKPAMAVVPAPEPPKDDGPRVIQTLRLKKDAWRQLKELAIRLTDERGVPVRQTEVIHEALNDYFKKHGLPALL